MDGDCSDVELTAQRPLIQGLDVLQLVDVLDILCIHFSFGQRVEHERVVGIGTVSEMNYSAAHPLLPRERRASVRALVMSF